MVSTTSDEGSSSHPPITIIKRQRADAPLAQNKFLKKTARGKVLQSIRQTLHYYPQHLSSSSHNLPQLVLLTDDKRNRELAQAEALTAVFARDYVDGLQGEVRDKLVDLVVGGVDEMEPGERRSKRIYDDETLTAGVKSGRFLQGYFNANQYNYLEGTVRVAGMSKQVLLVGRQAMNRSVDGDMVVVELLPESEWKAPGDEVLDQDVALKDDDVEGDDVAVEEKTEKQEEMDVEEVTKKAKREVMPTGRVVGVTKRNWRAYVCHIDRSSLSEAALTSLSQQTVFATPVSPALPRIRLRTRQAPALLDQKILVTIDNWTVNSRYPDGHFVRALGQVGSKEAEQESLMLEYEVPYRPFGKAILNCLPKEGDDWKVPPKAPENLEWRDREDLRDLLVCSIDPPGCQDIDDALHARKLPNGNIEAGVHIADVSHFVHADNPMDSEAAARGTTVYLVDKRIDMLPALLGTNLCSLRPYVERLAFSVIWELTPEGKIVDVRFTKSLTDPLTESIRLLNSLAINLKAARIAAGALSLSSPELKIHLNSTESTAPIDVEQKEQLETNSLVEEFMLLANISVARRIQEAYPATAVLSSKALADSLDKCVDPKLPEFNTLVRIMATRCMLSAEYFGAGSVSKEAYGHYGLASDIYTHFTSPIRRYADVLVHRQLSAAINYTPLHPSLQSKQHVERMLNVVNKRHRLAQMAGRASVEFYVGLAVKSRTEDSDQKAVREEAFVIRTFRNGLSVFVSKLGLEGLITFQKDTHDFDPENYCINVPKPGGGTATIAVFDRVTVDISIEKDQNTQRHKVKMVLVDPVSSEGL
ncbi:nucleolar exosome component, involved in rRNA processing and RNA degradation, Dis3p [Trichosporon asahii var. asahii CBS 8904]|uniref:Ribosomal RNA-processing protein 44 n=1 Tax=Trichosporon asahii var. asahii (strain CBS 8904) TaxID=1220162 RepID=K1VFW4_TRIAC|nr:nucleolar exosome component, involved in rRNA processing and RNA degradation, Dis3p [Trichosporon asahii var. asahii CBS 8904]